MCQRMGLLLLFFIVIAKRTETEQSILSLFQYGNGWVASWVRVGEIGEIRTVVYQDEENACNFFVYKSNESRIVTSS